MNHSVYNLLKSELTFHRTVEALKAEKRQGGVGEWFTSLCLLHAAEVPNPHQCLWTRLQVHGSAASIQSAGVTP